MADFFHSTKAFELILCLISIVAGGVGAVMGLGGGVILVPVLTLFFGVNIRYAIGASIVSVIATSSGAAAAYVRDHVTNIRVAMLLEVATTVGALTGALLSPYLSVNALSVIFAAIVIYSAYAMYHGRQEKLLAPGAGDRWAERLKLDSSYPDAVLGREVSYGVGGVPAAFGLMVGAGAISGLLGIGSGVLKVPAMDRAMRLPIKVSSATSNFMIGVTAAASAGMYYTRGDIVPMIAAPVALGVLIGSRIGAKVMMRLPAARLRVAFVAILVIIAVEMIFKTLGFGVR